MAQAMALAMTRAKAWLAALALAALCAAPLAGRAEPVRLSPEALAQQAAQLLLAKRADLALPLAQALAQAKPQDFSAQLLLSYAARDQGDSETAVAAGRAAWKLAQTDAQRNSAALAAAQAQSSAGHRTAAQLWLRRAYQTAPTAQAQAVALRDFRYVRARNPWTYTLDFGVSPSSNVNGGTGADTMWLFGLPFVISGDAQALSGLETHGSLGVERTVWENSGQIARLGLNLAGRGYRLSREAKAQAPAARGADYAFWASELYLSARMRAARPADEWDLRLVLGHNDYGGAPLSDYARLDAGRSFGLGAGRSLHLGATLERQWRLDDAQNSATLRNLDLEWHQTLGPGQLSFGLKAGEVASGARQVAHEVKGASLGYALSKPVLGADLSVSMGYERSDFGVMPFSTDTRTDHRLTLGVGALLRNRQYMGFAPELGLGYSRNRSNSVLHDSRDLSLSLRLKSLF